MDPGKSNDIVDWNIFGQVLEMDDDKREFSRMLVNQYYEQAESTFKDMNDAVQEGDAEKLGQLGHFLKGSSASLGLTKVQNTCEEIQRLPSSSNDLNTAEMQALLDRVRNEYDEVRARFKSFYTDGS